MNKNHKIIISIITGLLATTLIFTGIFFALKPSSSSPGKGGNLPPDEIKKDEKEDDHEEEIIKQFNHFYFFSLSFLSKITTLEELETITKETNHFQEKIKQTNNSFNFFELNQLFLQLTQKIKKKEQEFEAEILAKQILLKQEISNELVELNNKKDNPKEFNYIHNELNTLKIKIQQLTDQSIQNNFNDQITELAQKIQEEQKQILLKQEISNELVELNNKKDNPQEFNYQNKLDTLKIKTQQLTDQKDRNNFNDQIIKLTKEIKKKKSKGNDKGDNFDDDKDNKLIIKKYHQTVKIFNSLVYNNLIARYFSNYHKFKDEINRFDELINSKEKVSPMILKEIDGFSDRLLAFVNSQLENKLLLTYVSGNRLFNDLAADLVNGFVFPGLPYLLSSKITVSLVTKISFPYFLAFYLLGYVAAHYYYPDSYYLYYWKFNTHTYMNDYWYHNYFDNDDEKFSIIDIKNSSEITPEKIAEIKTREEKRLNNHKEVPSLDRIYSLLSFALHTIAVYLFLDKILFFPAKEKSNFKLGDDKKDNNFDSSSLSDKKNGIGSKTIKNKITKIMLPTVPVISANLINKLLVKPAEVEVENVEEWDYKTAKKSKQYEFVITAIKKIKVFPIVQDGDWNNADFGKFYNCSIADFIATIKDVIKNIKNKQLREELVKELNEEIKKYCEFDKKDPNYFKENNEKNLLLRKIVRINDGLIGPELKINILLYIREEILEELESGEIKKLNPKDKNDVIVINIFNRVVEQLETEIKRLENEKINNIENNAKNNINNKNKIPHHLIDINEIEDNQGEDKQKFEDIIKTDEFKDVKELIEIIKSFDRSKGANWKGKNLKSIQKVIQETKKAIKVLENKKARETSLKDANEAIKKYYSEQKKNKNNKPQQQKKTWSWLSWLSWLNPFNCCFKKNQLNQLVIMQDIRKMIKKIKTKLINLVKQDGLGFNNNANDIRNDLVKLESKIQQLENDKTKKYFLAQYRKLNARLEKITKGQKLLKRKKQDIIPLIEQKIQEVKVKVMAIKQKNEQDKGETKEIELKLDEKIESEVRKILRMINNSIGKSKKDEETKRSLKDELTEAIFYTPEQLKRLEEREKEEEEEIENNEINNNNDVEIEKLVQDIKDIENMINEIKNKLIELIKIEVQDFDATVNDIKNNLNNLENKIKQLKEVQVKEVQEVHDDLFDKYDALNQYLKITKERKEKGQLIIFQIKQEIAEVKKQNEQNEQNNDAKVKKKSKIKILEMIKKVKANKEINKVNRNKLINELEVMKVKLRYYGHYNEEEENENENEEREKEEEENENEEDESEEEENENENEEEDEKKLIGDINYDINFLSNINDDTDEIENFLKNMENSINKITTTLQLIDTNEIEENQAADRVEYNEIDKKNHYVYLRAIELIELIANYDEKIVEAKFSGITNIQEFIEYLKEEIKNMNNKRARQELVQKANEEIKKYNDKIKQYEKQPNSEQEQKIIKDIYMLFREIKDLERFIKQYDLNVISIIKKKLKELKNKISCLTRKDIQEKFEQFRKYEKQKVFLNENDSDDSDDSEQNNKVVKKKNLKNSIEKENNINDSEEDEKVNNVEKIPYIIDEGYYIIDEYEYEEAVGKDDYKNAKELISLIAEFHNGDRAHLMSGEFSTEQKTYFDILKLIEDLRKYINNIVNEQARKELIKLSNEQIDQYNKKQEQLKQQQGEDEDDEGNYINNNIEINNKKDSGFNLIDNIEKQPKESFCSKFINFFCCCCKKKKNKKEKGPNDIGFKFLGIKNKIEKINDKDPEIKNIVANILTEIDALRNEINKIEKSDPLQYKTIIKNFDSMEKKFREKYQEYIPNDISDNKNGKNNKKRNSKQMQKDRKKRKSLRMGLDN